MLFNSLIIKLYDLPFDWSFNTMAVRQKSLNISKPIGPDRQQLLRWTGAHFPMTWQSGLKQALS